MSWLDDTENHRKRQIEQLAKALGGDNTYFQKRKDGDTAGKSKKKDKTLADKSDMYKMRLLGLRKFNEQDQKEYVGVEDVANSYITNQENGDIVICKIDDGYLVSKFPIDTEHEEGEEKETTTLSEAIDVALVYKEDLEDAKSPEEIMYKEDTEKASTDDDEEDEVNPFEVEAWEAEHNDVAKAYAMLGLDYDIEKAKHQDGDMHPNGKWVWRQSANGGKGDWRVAKPGDNKATAGGGAVATAKKTTSKQTDDSNKRLDWDDITVTELDDGGLYTMLDKKRGIVTIGSKQYRVDLKNESLSHMNSGVKVKSNAPEMARFKKLLDANKKGERVESKNNTVTHDINGTKVTVTKNSDGSYTLEANGKKVKSDDPSYFVFGTNIKPRVKAALAKEVGIK